MYAAKNPRKFEWSVRISSKLRNIFWKSCLYCRHTECCQSFPITLLLCCLFRLTFYLAEKINFYSMCSKIENRNVLCFNEMSSCLHSYFISLSKLCYVVVPSACERSTLQHVITNYKVQQVMLHVSD